MDDLLIDDSFRPEDENTYKQGAIDDVLPFSNRLWENERDAPEDGCKDYGTPHREIPTDEDNGKDRQQERKAKGCWKNRSDCKGIKGPCKTAEGSGKYLQQHTDERHIHTHAGCLFRTVVKQLRCPSDTGMVDSIYDYSRY